MFRHLTILLSWEEEAISKGMMRHQNAKCSNCGKIEHLIKDYRQGIPGNNVSSGNVKIKTYQLSGLCRWCGKGQHWTNECRSTTTTKKTDKPT